MKAAAALLLAALRFVAATRAEDVVTLDGEEAFEKAVKDSSFLVAEFYAPWCGHCKTLAPEYEKAAAALKAKGQDIVLAKTDATLEVNKGLASKYGIQGFPTLKVFRNGDAGAPADYNGPRDEAGIVAHLEKLAGPSSALLTTAQEVAEHSAKPVAVLGVFSGADAPELAAFTGAADRMREDFDFAHTFDATLVKDAEAAPAAVLYKTWDVPVTAYDGEYETDALGAWVDAAATPVLTEMDQSVRNKRSLARIFSNAEKPKFLAVAQDDTAGRKVKAEMMAAAADADLAGFSFLWVDPGSAQQVPTFFGMEKGDYPALAIHDQPADGKYVKKNVKPADVRTFLADFQAGKLEKHVKSEAVPASNDGPVATVVAKTFREIVMGPKTVLIEFYAPWCGHCKNLVPTYDKLGEHFAGEEGVVIAKMDATANDIPEPGFPVQGFPAIFLAKADNSIVAYDGDRSLDSLVAFVANHAGAADTADEDDEADEASAEEAAAEAAALEADAADAMETGAEEEVARDEL